VVRLAGFKRNAVPFVEDIVLDLVEEELLHRRLVDSADDDEALGDVPALAREQQLGRRQLRQIFRRGWRERPDPTAVSEKMPPCDEGRPFGQHAPQGRLVIAGQTDLVPVVRNQVVDLRRGDEIAGRPEPIGEVGEAQVVSEAAGGAADPIADASEEGMGSRRPVALGDGGRLRNPGRRLFAGGNLTAPERRQPEDSQEKRSRDRDLRAGSLPPARPPAPRDRPPRWGGNCDRALPRLHADRIPGGWPRLRRRADTGSTGGPGVADAARPVA
jgi:hypothetical protein